MLKKLFKSIAMVVAVLCLTVNTGLAKDIDINLFSEDSQYEFWLNLAPDFLLAEEPAGAGCDTVTEYAFDEKHGMADGENCDITGDDSDRVRISYSKVPGDIGLKTVLGKPGQTVPPGTLAASDVHGASFVQATYGWEDGNQSFPGPKEPITCCCFPITPAEVATLSFFNPVVVPYAFYANGSVCEYRCTLPGPAPAGASYAYSKYDRPCVPDAGPRTGSGPSDDCVGYYKCVDSVCQDGLQGTAGETACTVPQDCTDGSLDGFATMCTEMPLQNVTQSMVQQIFTPTNAATDWSDFGDAYCAGPIQLCMRHATFDLAIMQGTPIISNSIPVGVNQRWHFTDASDLMKCVTDFDGAIGYATADNLLTLSGTGAVNGTKLVKYNGAAPTRENIVHGVYEFWAANWVYYNAADFADADYETVRAAMEAFSSAEANLTHSKVGRLADYWATQNEMLVERYGGAYGGADLPIKRK